MRRWTLRVLSCLLVAGLVGGCTNAGTSTSTVATSAGESQPTQLAGSTEATPPSINPATTETPSSVSVPESSVQPTLTQTASSVVIATLVPYVPEPDADPGEGDCPYLTTEQVQQDTSDRIGRSQIRPADPQPVCDFFGVDDSFLATVRVLQFSTDAEAIGAVDFYVPPETSNPESKPAGWSGGSMRTDGGGIYAVSKGGWAVIAQTNQVQTVAARQVVVHAIESLGI